MIVPWKAKCTYGHPLPLMDMTDKQAKEMNELLRKASWSTASLRDCLQGEFISWCAEESHRAGSA